MNEFLDLFFDTLSSRDVTGLTKIFWNLIARIFENHGVIIWAELKKNEDMREDLKIT